MSLIIHEMYEEVLKKFGTAEKYAMGQRTYSELEWWLFYVYLFQRDQHAKWVLKTFWTAQPMDYVQNRDSYNGE